MINGKKVCVVMPAYNAEKILKKTYDETPKDTDGASPISFCRSVTYGMGVMQTAVKYAMAKRRMGHFKTFNPNGKKLRGEPPEAAKDSNTPP